MADDPAAQLSNLPLYSLLSGPLTAAIEAEQEAAYHTLRFIQEVGFTGTGEKQRVRTIEFGYTRSRRGPTGETQDVQVTLSIPFLLLFPIPSLEIDALTVDFLAKLREVETIKDEGDHERSRLASKYSFLKGRNRLRVRPTPRKKEETEKTTTSYDLSVSLEARAQEPPEGIERLMDGLAGLMSEQEEPREG
jgi:hypothetical protein